MQGEGLAAGGEHWPHINADPADLQNTVTKYGEKRAMVALAQHCGFSAFFGQDRESQDQEIAAVESEAPQAPQVAIEAAPEPQAAPAPPQAPPEPAEAPSEVFDRITDPHQGGPDIQQKVPMTGNTIEDIKSISMVLSVRVGQTPEEVIYQASTFTGRDGEPVGFRVPKDRMSEKWLKGTLKKLTKRLNDEGFAAVVIGETPF